MKSTKLLTLALCLVACIATTVSFADDFGIESATPIVIADPVNPQPGMICKFYNVKREEIKKCLMDKRQREQFPLLVSRIDKGNDFVCNFTDKNIDRNVMSWEGYVKCKRAGAYVFTIFGAHDHEYTLEVNGEAKLIHVNFQKSVTHNLKVGWNKIVFTAIYWCPDKDVYKITYLPLGSLAEPRSLGPKDFFFDQKPEEDW